MDAEDAERTPELEPRPPDQADLVALCRKLNELGAKYVIVGGFAMIAADFPKLTGDIDMIVATDPRNEARVLEALEILADKAVLELRPGEIGRYGVVRVADEIIVDLMQSACGIAYEEAAREVVVREVEGVPIPFASPRLLWRTKRPTGRDKDAGDLAFLREYFRQRGEEPPAC